MGGGPSTVRSKLNISGGGGWSLYGEVQCIMGNDHTGTHGPHFEQTYTHD